MANLDHVAILKGGVKEWNEWREQHPHIQPDLDDYDLTGTDLMGMNLSRANLNSAVLCKANLMGADLTFARLVEAQLVGAELFYGILRYADLSLANLTGAIAGEANLIGARLVRADLTGVDLHSANLSGADLSESVIVRADLSRAILNEANLTDAILRNCNVYGVAVWNVNLSGTQQSNLSNGAIEVDNIDIAQFIHILLDSRKVRQILDSITSKVVLILGRFTPDRKAVLDSIRDELRKRDYLPVLFDFDKPANGDITETVSTLAHMARFVIADLSDPKSIPHELAHVTPLLPSVPIMPLIVRPQKEYAMFEHFFGFRHVLKPLRYRDETHLLSMLNDKVIAPAEKLAQRVAGRRSRR